MNYVKIIIYDNGKIDKENVTEEDANGYIGGIYTCIEANGKTHTFFINEESKIQSQYEKYIKRKINDCNKEIIIQQKKLKMYKGFKLTI